MHRALAVGIVVVVGLIVAGCGGSELTASPGVAPEAVPAATQLSALPSDLVCYPSTPTDGCPLGTVPLQNAAWSREWNAPVQAALLGMVEEQYATCYSYATLDRDVVSTTAASGPIGAACSTSGLTQTEALQIQGLIMESA